MLGVVLTKNRWLGKMASVTSNLFRNDVKTNTENQGSQNIIYAPWLLLRL